MKRILFLLLWLPVFVSGQFYYYYAGSISAVEAQMRSYAAANPTAKWVDVNYTGTTQNGGYDTPYTTIAAAIAGQTSGLIIAVKPGIYQEARYLYQATGSTTKYHTIQGFGTVELKLAAGGDADAYVVYSHGGTVYLNNLTINCIKSDGTTKRANAVYADAGSVYLTDCIVKSWGTATTSYAIRVNYSSGTLSLTRCSFYDSPGYVATSNVGLSVIDCYVHSDLTAATTVNCFTCSATSGTVEVKGTRLLSAHKLLGAISGTCTVTLDGNSCLGISVCSTTTTGAVVVQNCINVMASGTADNVISISGASSAVVSGNTLTSSTTFTTSKSYIYVINCPDVQVLNNNIETTSTATHAHITVLSNVTATRCDIKNNVSKMRTKAGYNIRVGVDAGSTADDNKLNVAVIENNWCYGSIYYGTGGTYDGHGVHGIFVGWNTNATIRYNYLRGIGRACINKDNDGVSSGGGIYGNVIIDCAYGVIIQDIQGLKIYNNTCYYTTLLIASTEAIAAVRLNHEEGSGCGTTDLRNNIISMAGNWSVKSGLGAYCIMGLSGTAGSTSDYNLYQIGTSVNCEQGYASLTLYQAAGYEAHGSSGDPLFTNTASYQLWPAVSSPAIGMGVNLGSPYDYLVSPSNTVLSSVIKTAQPASWTVGSYSTP